LTARFPKTAWSGAPGRVAREGRIPWRLGWPVLEPSVGLALMVLGLALGLAVARIWMAWRIRTPWILGDELLYSELAKSVAEDGRFLVREQATKVSSALYPVLIAPAWLAPSMTATYALAKAINVVVMTLAAVPLYRWARRLVPPAYAAVAVALFLFLPAFLFTSSIMSENAFLPAFVLAAFAIALALERPTLVRQAVALAAIVLACGVHLEALVLLLVFPTAIVLKILLDRRASDASDIPLGFFPALGSYWPSAAALVLAALGYVATKALAGASLSSGLGPYEAVGQAGYSPADTTRWALFHFAELSLSVGLIPASAAIVLVGLALRRHADTSPAQRAFLAVTVSATGWIVLQAGAFASEFADRVVERNVFYLSPLLLLALVLWLAQGVPRPRPLVVVAALTTAVPLLSLPFPTLLDYPVMADAHALVPFWRLTLGEFLPAGVEDIGTEDVKWIAGGVGLLAALLFALVPRRATVVALPTAVAAFLAGSSYFAFGPIANYSHLLETIAGTTPHKSWVDQTLGGNRDAVYLYATSLDPEISGATWIRLWETEFWNRSVGTVYSFGADDPYAPLPERQASIDPESGRILAASRSDSLASAPVFARYAIADGRFHVWGPIIKQIGRLALYRVEQPLRLAVAVEGVYEDGWMAEKASYSRYVSLRGRPGWIEVTVSREVWGDPEERAEVRVEVGPLVVGEDGKAQIGRATALRTWLGSGRLARKLTIPTPEPPFRVEVHVTATFAPGDYGATDARRLGARVDFRFFPSIDAPGELASG
jgi:hypothetical protein